MVDFGLINCLREVVRVRIAPYKARTIVNSLSLDVKMVL